MNNPPDYTDAPCVGSNDWTLEAVDNPGQAGRRDRDGNITENQRVYEARLRSKLICMTECPLRDACLKAAFDTPRDEDHYIWGGYSAAERERIRQGRLNVPKRVPKSEFIDWPAIKMFTAGASLAEVGELTRHELSLYTYMQTYLWRLRLLAGDGFINLPDETSRSVDAA